MKRKYPHIKGMQDIASATLSQLHIHNAVGVQGVIVMLHQRQ